jgi:hypothetical protein
MSLSAPVEKLHLSEASPCDELGDFFRLTDAAHRDETSEMSENLRMHHSAVSGDLG